MQSAQRQHPASAIGIGLHRLHGLHTVDLQRVRLDRQTALLQKRAEVVGLELFIGKLRVHEGCEYLIFCLSKVSKQLAAQKFSEVDPGAVVRNPKVCGVDLRLFMKETDPSESVGACLDGGGGARQNGLIVRVRVVCVFVGLLVCCLPVCVCLSFGLSVCLL